MFKKKTKRRKATNNKPKKRRTMAKKKASRPRRRSTGSRSKGKAMDVAMSIAMGVAGYVAAGAVARMLPIQSATTRGLVLTAGAVFAAGMLPAAMMPVAIGMGIRGGVTAAQQLLPGITGIGDLPPAQPRLSEAQYDALEMALLEGAQGVEYQENLMGEDDEDEDMDGLDDRNGPIMDAEEQYEQD